MKKTKLLFSAILLGITSQSFADVNTLANNNPGSVQETPSYPGLNFPKTIK